MLIIDPFKQSNLIRDYNELYQKIYDKEKYINLWTSMARWDISIWLL